MVPASLLVGLQTQLLLQELGACGLAVRTSHDVVLGVGMGVGALELLGMLVLELLVIAKLIVKRLIIHVCYLLII